eukprot:scaffold254934_cov17-Tisochrysis_lutea.AAC.1
MDCHSLTMLTLFQERDNAQHWLLIGPTLFLWNTILLSLLESRFSSFDNFIVFWKLMRCKPLPALPAANVLLKEAISFEGLLHLHCC